MGCCGPSGVDFVSPEDLEVVSHVVSSQGCTVQCTVDVRDTSIQITATGLPSVGLCVVLAPSDFNLLDAQKKRLGSHR